MTTRRDFLWHMGGGLGGVALTALLAEGSGAKPTLHHPPKARRVVPSERARGKVVPTDWTPL